MNTLSDKVKSLPDNILVQMCNEIFDWGWGSTGCLDQNSEVAQLARAYSDGNAYQTKDYILREADRRFEKVVKVLFSEYASSYIKK